MKDLVTILLFLAILTLFAWIVLHGHPV